MNAPCSGAPLTAPHVTTGGLCRWKAINKEGRHVGLDFYDLRIEALIDRVVSWRVESITGAVALASRCLVGWAFASPTQSGLAWLCFLFPLIEPDRRSYRIRLSEKTHGVTCDAVGNF